VGNVSLICTHATHFTASRYVDSCLHVRCSLIIYFRFDFQRWNGNFFEHTTLNDLGLRIQLGHRVGERCSNPATAAGDNFVVIDTNGVHEVGLDYCGCETAQHRTTQLLRARWYPATPVTPNTAATFNVLEYFHLLTFESKASVFEFLHALMRRTNNISITDVPVSFTVSKVEGWWGSSHRYTGSL
jgi:CxC2 like cysteine cluster associated with KDZ transposases